MATKWYNKRELLVWIGVIIATIGVGAFIFMSTTVPDRFRLWLGIADYGLFSYANFRIIALRNLDRQTAAKESENRAARRQAERLKNK